jgi:hypothetical protein
MMEYLPKIMELAILTIGGMEELLFSDIFVVLANNLLNDFLCGIETTCI